MKINKIIFFVTLLSLSSCTFFLKKIDDTFNNAETKLTFKKNLNSYCKNSASFELISDNEKNQEQFDLFLQTINKKYKISFIDHVVLWALIQMNLRPDQSSPTSKLTVFLKVYNKESNYTFYGINPETHSYILGLDYLLKQYRSNFSLFKLAVLIDRYYPDSFFVSKQFESYLLANFKEINKIPILGSSFTKGDESLRYNERIPKQSFEKIVKNGMNSKKSDFKVEESLVDYHYNDNTRASCNFDLSLYKDNIFLINNDLIKSNVFGLKSYQNSAMLSSGQKFESFENIPQSVFIKGYSNTRTATFCSIYNKNQPEQTIWISATNSRDPGQHIYHLLEYGIGKSSSIHEIDKLIKFSRHIFLRDPLRLIYESDRSSDGQTEKLLKLKIPIYSANGLAQLWGYFHKTKSHNGFITDERSEGTITCQN